MPILLSNSGKNYIMNGAFDFFQRSVSNAVTLTTTASYATADRFRVKYSGTVTGTPQTTRSTQVPSGSIAPYSLQFNSQRNASAVSLFAAQRVESVYTKEISGKTLFAGIKVKSIAATGIRLVVRTPSAADNYTSTTEVYNQTKTIAADNNWQTVIFDSMNISIMNGAEVEVELICPSGTDGVVVSHYITEFFWGTSPSFERFEPRVDSELRAVLRYYEKSYQQSTVPGTVDSVGQMYCVNVSAATAGWTTMFFKQVKRTIPTVNVYAASSGAIGNVTIGGSNVAASVQAISESNCFISVGSGTNQGVSFHFTVEAEL